MVEISNELLEIPPEPLPVIIQPANCPIVLDQYMNLYDDLTLKLGLIKEAQDNILGDH